MREAAEGGLVVEDVETLGVGIVADGEGLGDLPGPLTELVLRILSNSPTPNHQSSSQSNEGAHAWKLEARKYLGW